ncbi:light harvesting complex protein [Baffinella frigidus]|nr:light harvesting complex protein [Cryptophyta sp. CCMP2293]
MGKLTPALFAKLDIDGSGSIDAAELKLALGDAKDVATIMARADMDGNGAIDYAEYERLMAMETFSDENGGNLYVRNAINLGLLKKDSVLADNIMVGNKGFDPLNLATSTAQLKQYREAELKHGRLAMLAAAGWPMSELLQPMISQFLKQPDLLTRGGEAPSILNGGLDQIPPFFFLAIIVFSGTVESLALTTRTLGADYTPGDLGFDPLSLYSGKSEATKRDFQLKELNNGRLAMLAITWYAAAEFIGKSAVVDGTPFLFKSIL